MPKLATKPIVSAGGVVYRIVDDRLEVVLGCLADRGAWMLPKGTPRKGEALQQTAEREVREETGLDVVSLGEIGLIEYWFVARRTRFHKKVHYFLMAPIGGEMSRHDREFDDVEWIPYDRCLEMITFANEAAIVEKAAQLIYRTG